MEITANLKKYFTKQLLSWHHNDNDRDLPWKNEKDPYKIWLSEVILQQTRARQGLPYYLQFIEAYPTIEAMANAHDEEAFRIWQGLGYYNRCSNMLATARYVARELAGKFPRIYEQIIGLKGVGPYTAAAISSFAYGLPHAVVDGNVYRVLSRYFGIDTPFDTTEGKNIFSSLAQELLDVKNSAAYNQAIMDLGATVCTPKNAQCTECPLQKNCTAYRQNIVHLLPVRSKKVTVTTRYFHYLLLVWDGKLWISQRPEKDIWASLHEPYLVEHTAQLDLSGLQKEPAFRELQLKASGIIYSGSQSQRLTHRIIQSSFFTVQLTAQPDRLPVSGSWVSANDLKKIAFPKTVLSFLKNNLYF